MDILSIDTIVSDQKIRGGRPVIAGTSIRVSDLVAYHLGVEKMNAKQLAKSFQLSLGQVYAALAYYHFHQDEIDEEIRQNAQEAQTYMEVLKQQGRFHQFG